MPNTLLLLLLSDLRCLFGVGNRLDATGVTGVRGSGKVVGSFSTWSVQQSHFGSQFAFWHFNLQIELKIGAQMRTVIPHFKHLKIKD